MSAPAPGQRVADQFESYRSLPPGPAKRRMASQLLRGNEALIQHTIDSLCGRKPLRLRKPFAGCQGFDKLDPDDAMQAGRLAFAKALDQFDPAKVPGGRGMKGFPYYLLSKARNELHNIETWGHHLLHVPEAHVAEFRSQRQVTLFGAFRALESGDEHQATTDAGAVQSFSDEPYSLDFLAVDGDIRGTDDFTVEDVERWQESGEWPEDIETWRAERAQLEDDGDGDPEPEPTPEDTRTALERFLDEELRFRSTARSAREPVLGSWRRFGARTGAYAAEHLLRVALSAHGVRPTTVRAPGCAKTVAGFAGVELSRNAFA
jgi:hypothetical protein